MATHVLNYVEWSKQDSYSMTQAKFIAYMPFDWSATITRPYIPKYSQINSIYFVSNFRRSSAGSSDDDSFYNTDIEMYLGTSSGTAEDNICTLIEQRTGVITTFDKPYGATIPSEYINSKNESAGEFIGSDVIVAKLSGNFTRTYTTSGGSMTVDYTPPTYTINAVATEGGAVSGGGTWDVTVTDQTKTIIATPNAGYKFVKWKDSDGNTYTSASLDVTISQNNISAFETSKTYTAYFEPISILVGTSQPSKIYIDTQEVKEVYVGTTKVYG